MTTTKNTFEGTNGSTINAASSTVSGDAVTVFNTGGGVCQYDNSDFMHGAMSAHMTSTNGSGTIQGFLPDVAATQFAWRGYFKLTTVTGFQARPLLINGQSDAQAALVLVQTSGVLVRDSTATSMFTSPDATAWPMNVWVRLEITLNVSTGAAAVATYNGDSTTPLWSASMASGWNFGTTTTIKRALFGQSGSHAMDLHIDDVAQSDSQSTFLGVPTVKPTISGSVLDNQARIVANASGGATGSYTYTISQTAGTATSPLADGTGAWLVTKPTSGSLTYQVKATDSAGTDSDPVTVNVGAATAAAVWPKRPVGSLPSTNWN